LLIESPQDPQKDRDVPVLAEQNLRVAKLVSKLLSQFFLCEQGFELAFLQAYVWVQAPAVATTRNLVPYHSSAFAVVRARTNISLQETTTVSMDGLPRSRDDLLQRFELYEIKKWVFH
jgi:hypothetical protein